MIQRTDIRKVMITDGFLKEKQRLIVNTTVPYIWKALNDQIPGIIKSGAVDNFRIAAGRKKGTFSGLVSQDSDLFKWMEAASYALLFPDTKETASALEKITDLIADAQQKDGYLNTYYILNGLNHRWDYLKESCQLYCAGHFIEAAVANFQTTGSRKLLDLARRYADCIDENFGSEDGKIKGYDGHAEIELALYRLYECTGEERYRSLARFFVEERGKKPSFFSAEKRLGNIRENLVYELSEEDFSHSQSHVPLREQKEAKGHAVKAMYFYSAAADEVRLENDAELHCVLKTLWADVTGRKMYLTGAIGAREYGESFSYAYDLPSDLMYGETCASIGLFLWAARMMLLEENSQYADVMEMALYNGILCGISESGTGFFYTNALEIDPVKCDNRKEYAHICKERQPWFECPCCPPNIARILLSLQNYLYTFDEDCLYVHHYTSSVLDDRGWRCVQVTNYPFENRIELNITVEKDAAVKLRIPGWCERFTLQKDGEYISDCEKQGYVKILLNGNTTHKLILELEMNPYKVYANIQVEALHGKAALKRGPVVYCAEEIDNPFLSNICLKKDGMLEMRKDEITAEGLLLNSNIKNLYGKEPFCYTPCKIKFIPYFQWNNRGQGRMKTFLDEREGCTDETENNDPR